MALGGNDDYASNYGNRGKVGPDTRNNSNVWESQPKSIDSKLKSSNNIIDIKHKQAGAEAEVSTPLSLEICDFEILRF